MVVTKKEFQEVIEQMNNILTKLDQRIKELEEQKTPRNTKTAKSVPKDLTNE
jgi:prefoldin subunit 5